MMDEKKFYEYEYEKWMKNNIPWVKRYGKEMSEIIFTKSVKKVRKDGASRFEEE